MGGASGFEFADFVLQTVHIRSQIANDLGVVVGVPTTSVRVIPDFVLFIAGELHQSDTNRFGTGLRTLIGIRRALKEFVHRDLQRLQPIGRIRFAHRVIHRTGHVQHQREINRLGGGDRGAAGSALHIHVHGVTAIIVLFDALMLLRSAQLRTGLVLRNRLRPICSRNRLSGQRNWLLIRLFRLLFRLLFNLLLNPLLSLFFRFLFRFLFDLLVSLLI